MTASPNHSSAGTVSVRREWLEHVVTTLQGDLPTGRIGDVVFLLRGCLQDILDKAPDHLACAKTGPTGWKLVPITPTRKMIDRGYATRPVEECWRVMLEAAPNATPANRSTAKATAIVGDDRQSMGSEPAKGIVTGGSDPTLSPAPSSWQPISTAPKDGTCFLAWIDDEGHRIAYWAHWFDNIINKPCEGWMDYYSLDMLRPIALWQPLSEPEASSFPSTNRLGGFNAHQKSGRHDPD